MTSFNSLSLFLILLFNSLGFVVSAYSVELPDSVFVEDERYISKLVSELINVRFDDEKLNTLSKKVSVDFETILNKEGSFNYPFDSILSMAKVVSDDKLVRIFTWYAIRADGSHIHFGFIQYNSKVKKEVLIFPLIDKSDIIEDVENKTLTPDNWFGSTYYEIIQSKSGFNQAYVLLGWDGNNIYTKKKLIETLVFANDKPKFGVPIIVSGRQRSKRIVFEYSRMATMMLKYDKLQNMIIMDHLAPSKPVYNENYQFYGPDLSLDALKYENGLWVYYPTIDYKPTPSKKRNNRR